MTIWPSPTTTRSNKTYERIALLDVLRGLALFGIFVVNVQFMALPSAEALEPPDSLGWNFAIWFGVQSLFVSKFVGIFSLLFGAGFALQWQRARTEEAGFDRMYVRRSVLLLVIGLLHGVFLFEGDILLPYAIAGLILLAFKRLELRGLIVASVVCLLFAVISSGAVGLIDLGDEAVITGIEITVHREGPLLDLILDRSTNYAFWLAISSVIGFNWRILCAFFLGAALLKSGFFANGKAAHGKRFAVGALLFGGLSEAGLTWLTYVDESRVLGALAAGLHEFTSMVLALGYVGIVRLIVARAANAPLRFIDRCSGWIAAAGRMALSNYLLQSLLANVYFTFLGFAWYGELDQAQLFGLVSATFAAQTACSVLWMKYFRSGPVEWLWRSAIQSRRLPFKR